MWTILHCWQISISAGAKYCLSRANLTFCWFLDEQFRHGLECFSLVLLRNLSQYPSTFLQNKKTPQAASGSTWRVKAVIIEATSPPRAVSNAAWPAFLSGWQFERTGKTFNFKAALFLLLFPLLLFPIIPRSKVLDLGYDEEDGYARFSHWWGALNMHSVSQLEKGCNFPRRPHHDPNW